MSTSPDYRERVKQFQADLTTLNMRAVVRKHITTGEPVVITHDAYFELRQRVADHFGLHPSAVILVGSCRQGFSIAPKKRYRLAQPNSDLDLALISAERFDTYWDEVFAYSRSNEVWKKTSRFKKFVVTLFKGWIDPRGLPPVPRFKQSAEWVQFFDKLMAERLFGTRRISARLYRNWERLESYQESAVRMCRI